jgi:L-alanine-DL-glutamate epimerase-like enolase superfamily enzyme
MWLEDPVPPENVDALARVTRSTSTPIATGENGYMRHGFREAFEAGAIDIAAPDPQKTGGLLETRRIAVPDAPGLGARLNLDLAREYARPGEPFFDE